MNTSMRFWIGIEVVKKMFNESGTWTLRGPPSAKTSQSALLKLQEWRRCVFTFRPNEQKLFALSTFLPSNRFVWRATLLHRAAWHLFGIRDLGLGIEGPQNSRAPDPESSPSIECRRQSRHPSGPGGGWYRVEFYLKLIYCNHSNDAGADMPDERNTAERMRGLLVCLLQCCLLNFF